MNELALRRKIRLVVWIFIIGLFISGVTAIPLEWEMELLTRVLGVSHLQPENAPHDLARWLLTVRDALQDTNASYPFIAYGFDWLAFGHIVIAIAFIGLLKDPVRNIWLFDFALIACLLVFPWAFIFGAVRGIPIPWRLIDCSFGLIGLIPVFLGKRWTLQLAALDERAGERILTVS